MPGNAAAAWLVAPSPITTDGLVFILDAKLYDVSGTWKNTVVSPADGAAQAAYNFFPGPDATTTPADPTLTNGGTDNAYWSLDGGDYFAYSDASVANVPAFIRTMHQASKKFTIEAWMYYTTDASNISPVFDSGTSDQTGSDMSRGVIFGDLGNLVQTTGRFRFRVKQDANGVSALAVQSDAALAKNVVNMIAVSYDATNTQASFLYKNGAYDQVGGVDTWNGTPTSPGTTNTSNRPALCVRGDLNFPNASGTRLYILRVYNRNLTKAELDTNWNATKGRYGL